MDVFSELLVTNDEIEAEIIRDVLESENIHVIVNSMKISPYPVNIGDLGEIRILVRTDELEEAKRILKCMKNSRGADQDGC